MAEVTRKEFAGIVGKSVAYINVNLKRDKIMLIVGGEDDGKIDTENALNKAFAKHCRKLDRDKLAKDKASKISYEDIVEQVSMPEKGKDKKKNNDTRETRKAKAEQRKKALELAEFDYRKKKADAKKAESDAELKNLAVEKMMGKLMPVELVQQIIKINIQGVFIGFENELQNIASIYCDILAGGDRKRLAEVVDTMRENLSRIIKDTKENTKSEIEQVVENYAETRNRGEQK